MFNMFQDRARVTDRDITHPQRAQRTATLLAAILAALLITATPSFASAATLPSAEADGVHTVNADGKLSVFGMVNPNGGTVKYWFEFLSEAQYQEGAWTEATKTTAKASGGGLVWQEIPALLAGETYHYRLAVENEAQFKGEPQHSPTVRTLAIPAPEPETQPACPNEALRTGPSARLPDCRAYEQVTPANKEGADDIFDYGSFGENAVVGLDGERLIFQGTAAKWGPNVGGSFTGQNAYLFTRTPTEWTMASLYPQPQTGGVSLRGQGGRTFYPPDLSQALVEEELSVSPTNSSPDVEYALGSPGGPYKIVASEPEEEEGEHWGHWVAQSRDKSVAVIESPDHKLIPGEPTGTTVNREFGNHHGYDLYEYSGGRLSQVNVNTNGETIGTCGAEMVEGREGGGNRGQGQGTENEGISFQTGSINAVSADGSRIFFEAYPTECPGEVEEEVRFHGGSTRNIELYMRVDGMETVDIGKYTFEGANPEGTRLLLSKVGAGGLEYLSYDTETRSSRHLLSLQGDPLGSKHALSEDGDVYYFETTGSPLTPEAPANENDIYRYDIPNEELSFVAVSYQTEGNGNGGFYVSPDGGDFYFNVNSVQGVNGGPRPQVYRYDSAEDVVQCVSCASPFDPEPRLLSTLMPNYGPGGYTLAPLGSPASENGNFVFFDTPNALLSRDTNGEVEPIGGANNGSYYFSPSSDVYEWRRQGVYGCGRVQGCLALITSGIDGTENVLLGVGRSGEDVFIGTHSQLAPTDADHSGDIYDVRIDGGFPASPPPPTECEGDECSTSQVAPGDPTQTLLPAVEAAGEPVSVASQQMAKKKTTKRKGKPGKAKHGKHRRARAGARRVHDGRNGSSRGSGR